MDQIIFTESRYAPYIAYWTEKLVGINRPYRFPGNRDINLRSCRHQKMTILLGEKERTLIKNISQARPMETYILLLTGWYILSARYSDHRQIVIDSPLFTRDGSSQIYEPTVALIGKIDPEQSIKELIFHINGVVSDSYQYQNFPLDPIIEKEKLEPDIARTNVAIFSPEIHGQLVKKEKYDLILEIKQSQNRGLVVHLSYNPDCLDSRFVQQIADHYQRILASFLEIDTWIKNIDILSPKEYHRIVYDLNETQSNYPRDKTVVELFEEQAALHPEATALYFQGQSMTYQALNESANRLAHYLREQRSIQPDHIIAMVMDRSNRMIVAMLAILKAGAAYLPIVPDQPASRTALMLEHSGAALILTDQPQRVNRSENSIHILEIEEELSHQPSQNPSRITRSDNLIYVMYTSGSTGKPKGVMVEHRSVVRLVRDSNYTHTGPGDRILQLSDYSFDGSTYDIYAALLNGAALYLIPHDFLYDLSRLGDFILENQINIMFITTALINQLIDVKPETISCFDKIYFGGQDASVWHIRSALAQRKTKDAIVHVYGPTEATTFSTYYVIPDLDENATYIPIGSAIGNSQAYILDPYLNPAPPDVEGEIYVAGDGIARGYLNTDQTSLFPRSPFRPGERMYKTGDRGKLLPNGKILFLGRKDEQVKIRGFRVELGEVENALLQLPTIYQIFVTAIVKDHNKELVAYLTADPRLTVRKIRDSLSKTLPDYMIPAHYIRLEKLPLNRNGKVNKRALPVIDDPMPFGAYRLEAGSDFHPPETETERRIADAWQTILGRESIGVKDNYFSLGGDSIKAIRIVSRLHQEGVKAEVRDIFQYQTIAELADFLDFSVKGRTESQPEISVGDWSESDELTPIQRWFFENYGADADDPVRIGRFNQSILLESAQTLQEEALSRSIMEIYCRHGALRLRFSAADHPGKKDEQTILQRIIDPSPPDTRIFYLIDLRDKNDPESLMRAEIEKAQDDIDPVSGPLIKAVLFRRDSGDRLLIVVHHLAIDGVSWRILMEDLTVGYQNFLNDSPMTQYPETHSYLQWTQTILQYSQSQDLLKETDYWRRIDLLCQQERSTEARCVKRSDSRRIDLFTLTLEETEALMTQAHDAYNTQINDLLLTALVAAAGPLIGKNFLTIALEGHGRQPLSGIDINRVVGWFTCLYPVALPIPDQSDKTSSPLSHQIKRIKEELRSIPNKGIGYGILKYISPMNLDKKIRPQICFNYLGQFDEAESDLFQAVLGSSGEDMDPSLPLLYDLDFSGITLGSRLRISLTYNPRRFTEKSMRCLGADYRQELLDIIDHCLNKENSELTPSDVDYDGLGIEELEEALLMVEDL